MSANRKAWRFALVAAAMVMAVAWVWFVVFNRFQSLYFPEQLQLFQFTRHYFGSWMGVQGGVMDWCGAFLVQFNYFPALGGAIYAAVVAVLWWLVFSTARRAGLPGWLVGLTFAAPLWAMKYLTVAYAEMATVLWVVAAAAACRVTLWAAMKLAGLGCSKALMISPRAMFVNMVCVVVAGVALLGFTYDRHSENLIRMSTLVAQKKWDEILAIEHRTLPSPVSRVVTNLALSRTGRLPYEMFHYRQSGVAGLIPARTNYLMAMLQSDVYESLGLPAAAKHSTYEAMVAGTVSGNYGVQPLVRLMAHSAREGNRALFEKYAAIISSSLFYKPLVDEERRRLAPEPVDTDTGDDFFIGDAQEIVLANMLIVDPGNKAAFEYLMAGYMLDKQLDSARRCFDTHYAALGYPAIPTHWAEMLVMWENENAIGGELCAEIPRRVRDDYEEFSLLLRAAADEGVRRRLEEKFGKTFWYYYNSRP
jgi:hypothetical protein